MFSLQIKTFLHPRSYMINIYNTQHLKLTLGFLEMTMTSLSPDTRGCRFLYHYLIIIDIVMDPRPTIFIFVFRQRDDALLLVLLTLVNRFSPHN